MFFPALFPFVASNGCCPENGQHLVIVDEQNHSLSEQLLHQTVKKAALSTKKQQMNKNMSKTTVDVKDKSEGTSTDNSPPMTAEERMKRKQILRTEVLENVEQFLRTKKRDLEEAQDDERENFRRFKMFETSALQQKAKIDESIRDYRKSLTSLEMLSEQSEKRADPVELTYKLDENLYSRALIEEMDKVCIWLGANVMVEYGLDEAQKLLQSHLGNVEKTAKEIEEDIAFLQDQITTTEVNLANLYNYAVQNRKLVSLDSSVSAGQIIFDVGLSLCSKRIHRHGSDRCAYRGRCFHCECADIAGREGHQRVFLQTNPKMFHRRRLGLRTAVVLVPAKSEKSPLDGSEEAGKMGVEAEERLRIAWRYRTKPEIDSAIGAPSRNGGDTAAGIGNRAETKFDLSCADDRFEVDQLLDQGHVTVFDWDQQQPSLATLWTKIHREFAVANGTFLRFLIADLSSPLWADASLLQQFCAHLKAFCRRYNSAALLSLDSSSLTGSNCRQNILQFVDGAFKMERMDEREQKTLCLRRRIDGGRFYIVKLPAFRSAAPAVLPVSSDLLFSLRKRCFELKVLHLPPALGEEKEETKKPKCRQSLIDQF
uniref:Elongator complex protein 4 n=1 Tax=Globodera rostochiensis TaxID=31243 RepID=A0A914HQS9_GLORO